MTELEVPPEADEKEASRLVREFVRIGDEVSVSDEQKTETEDDERVRTSGEVTAVEPGYVELDGEGPDGKGVRYDEIRLMKRVAR